MSRKTWCRLRRRFADLVTLTFEAVRLYLVNVGFLDGGRQKLVIKGAQQIQIPKALPALHQKPDHLVFDVFLAFGYELVQLAQSGMLLDQVEVQIGELAGEDIPNDFQEFAFDQRKDAQYFFIILRLFGLVDVQTCGCSRPDRPEPR